MEVAMRHLRLFIDYAGERVALREIRKHLSWYSRGIPGAARFRSMVNTIEDEESLIRLLTDFFGKSLEGHVQ
jgi:tRNA-dihydrouridine synthase